MGGMDNGVGDIRVSRLPLSRSPSHCPCIACTLIIRIVLGLVEEREKFLRYFSPFDGWLTLDGLRFSNFFDISLNARKLFHSECYNETILRSIRGDQGHASQWSELFRF